MTGRYKHHESEADKVEADLALMEEMTKPKAEGRIVTYLGARHQTEGYDVMGNIRVVDWGNAWREERFTVESYVPGNEPGSLKWTQQGHAETLEQANVVLKYVVEYLG